MDFSLLTKKGRKEFKDVHITIRNVYDLKKAKMPLENIEKVLAEEDIVTLAEMLEIILKKYDVAKNDIADASFDTLKDVVEVMTGLLLEGKEEEFEKFQENENTGELLLNS